MNETFLRSGSSVDFSPLHSGLSLTIDWQLPQSNCVLQKSWWAEMYSRRTNQRLERRSCQAAPPNTNKKGIVVQTLDNISFLLAAQMQRRTTSTNSHKKTLVTAGAPPPLVYLKTLMINAKLSPDIQLYYSKKTCELISKNRISLTMPPLTVLKIWAMPSSLFQSSSVLLYEGILKKIETGWQVEYVCCQHD